MTETAQLLLDAVPASAVDVEVEWILHDGYGEQRWASANVPVAAVEGLAHGAVGRSRAAADEVVSLSAIVEGFDAEGRRVGRHVVLAEPYVVEGGSLVPAPQPPVLSEADTALYAPPGFTGRLRGGGVPSRTGVAPTPIPPVDQSDRDVDLPGVVVVGPDPAPEGDTGEGAP